MLEAAQLARLRRLLAALAANPFWAPRLAAAGLGSERGPVADLAGFRRLPTIAKDELVADQQAHPPYGSNLTYPLARYVRCHQTSGTSGAPMRWLDTAESWAWMLDGWDAVFGAAGVGRDDTVLVPFSFGPFLGFWTAFDAATRRGCLTVPGGGLDSAGRLRLLGENGVTAMCCTPTYALRLAEVARERGMDPSALAPRAIIVAGEPGGSVAAVRERIERAWPGARVYDHHGMTEVGPVSVPDPDRPGLLYVRESAYLAEVLEPERDAPVAPGEVGELVLTTLGRLGSPLLRYRTGDLVRPSARPPSELGRPDLALEGGILARVDDMVVVRGVNLYPSALEAVVRAAAGDAEYRVTLSRDGALSEVALELEAEGPEPARALERALREAFQLRIPVTPVAPGTLPRFELKARRWRRAC